VTYKYKASEAAASRWPLGGASAQGLGNRSARWRCGFRRKRDEEIECPFRLDDSSHSDTVSN